MNKQKGLAFTELTCVVVSGCWGGWGSALSMDTLSGARVLCAMEEKHFLSSFSYLLMGGFP